MTDPLKNNLKILADAYHAYRETADRVQKEQKEMIDKALSDIRTIQVTKAKAKIDSLLH